MMKYFTPSFSRLFLLLTAILGQASAADMLRDIQAEDLIVAPSIRAIQLSPKEDLIVFEKRTVDLEANRYHTHLWKMTSEGGMAIALPFYLIVWTANRSAVPVSGECPSQAVKPNP